MIGLFVVLSIVVTIVCIFLFKLERQTALIVGGLSLFLTLIATGASIYFSTSSIEILNGQVTEKYRDRVSCSHSYSCRCRTEYSGTGKDRTSRRVCDTCYEHWNDYDWVVKSTVGRFEINRINRQGTKEPPRWTEVKIGDPASTEHRYTNWIKTADHSLFNVKKSVSEQYKKQIPKYPGEIYDYYKINRIVTVGTDVPNLENYNLYLSNYLRQLGPSKQANMIFVITSVNDSAYADAVYSAWNGAEKNDIVVFLGVQNNEIKWASVKSWAEFDIFNVKLRDRLVGLKTFNMKWAIDVSVDEAYKSFKRKPMKKFEYLKNDIQSLSTFNIIMLVMIILIVHAGGFYISYNQYGGRRFRY